MKLKELINKTTTQAQVAKDLNLTPQTLNNYINGKTDPDIKTLIRIADYFHTTVDHIIEHDVPYLLDKSMLSNEQNNAINEIRKLSNDDCLRVIAYIAGLKQGKQDQEYIIKKFKGEA